MNFVTKGTKANLSKAREIGLSWLDFHPVAASAAQGRLGQNSGSLLATAEYNYGEAALAAAQIS